MTIRRHVSIMRNAEEAHKEAVLNKIETFKNDYGVDREITSSTIRYDYERKLSKI